MATKEELESPCVCGSKKLYSECCYPYHCGKKNAETASKLMRSRYSAYARKNHAYIIATTHRKNPCYQENKGAWIEDLEGFSSTTEFLGLKIIDYSENPEHDHQYVTFVATLRQGPDDLTFTEKSEFVKENDKWLYLSGVTLPGVHSKQDF